MDFPTHISESTLPFFGGANPKKRDNIRECKDPLSAETRRFTQVIRPFWRGSEFSCSQTVHDPNTLTDRKDLLGKLHTYAHFGVSIDYSRQETWVFETCLESRSKASLGEYVLRLKKWYKVRPSARNGSAMAVAGTFSKTAA